MSSQHDDIISRIDSPTTPFTGSRTRMRSCSQTPVDVKPTTHSTSCVSSAENKERVCPLDSRTRIIECSRSCVRSRLHTDVSNLSDWLVSLCDILSGWSAGASCICIRGEFLHRQRYTPGRRELHRARRPPARLTAARHRHHEPEVHGDRRFLQKWRRTLHVRHAGRSEPAVRGWWARAELLAQRRRDRSYRRRSQR